MKKIFEISKQLIALSAIMPIFKLIKSREEKCIETYYIRVIRRLGLEMLFVLYMLLLFLYLPKIVLIQSEKLQSNIILYFMVAIVGTYIIINNVCWRVIVKYTPIKSYKTIKKFKIVLFILYIGIGPIWAITANNVMVDAVNEEIQESINYEFKGKKVYDINHMKIITTVDEDYGEKISKYYNENYIIIIIYYLLVYIIIRVLAFPFVKEIEDKLNNVMYCNIRMKDGTIIEDAKFINRNNEFFIIKTDKQQTAIFLNIDEIVEIKFKYKHSIQIK